MFSSENTRLLKMTPTPNGHILISNPVIFWLELNGNLSIVYSNLRKGKQQKTQVSMAYRNL